MRPTPCVRPALPASGSSARGDRRGLDGVGASVDRAASAQDRPRRRSSMMTPSSVASGSAASASSTSRTAVSSIGSARPRRARHPTAGRPRPGRRGLRRLGHRAAPASAKTSSLKPSSGRSSRSPAPSSDSQLLRRQDLRREHLALDALDAQRQAAALGVDLEDLDLDVVAGRDDLARVLDVVRRELGDVDEALDAVEDLDERAERDDLRDRALELVADVVRVDDPLPWIFLGLFEAERDPLALSVYIQDLHSDRVADREDLRRVVDVRPGQLGDVDEAVDAVEVHERAEVDDVRDLALDDEAGLQAIEDLLALLLALLLEHRAARQDDVVARPVELDDLALDLRAHVLVEVRDAADVDERGGQEAAHPEVDDEPALDDLDDRALDGLAGLGRRLDAPPRLLEAGALLGHDQAAVLILLREDERVDLLAHLDLVMRVDGLANRKLVGGDDPLALVADVDEDFVVVDPDDDAGDDLALLEGVERRVVVGDDLPVDLEQQAVRTFDDLRLWCSFGDGCHVSWEVSGSPANIAPRTPGPGAGLSSPRDAGPSHEAR